MESSGGTPDQPRRPGRLAPVPFHQFFGQGPVDIDWIWEPFIPKDSTVLLSAYMKVGKSTFTYDLISSILRGDSFLNFRTKPVNVLLLAVEESARDVRNRLVTFGLGPETRTAASLLVHSGPLQPTGENLALMEDLIVRAQVGLVVVDTLSRFMQLDDENDNAEMQRVLVPWLDMGRRTETSLLLIHHNGKQNSEGGVGIRGASALLAMVDQAMILRYQGNHRSRMRNLETLGRYDETPRELVYELNDDYRHHLLGLGDTTLSQVIAKEIQIVLTNSPAPMTVLELALAVGRTVKQVQKALSPLPTWCSKTGKGVKGEPFRFALVA